MIWYYLFKLGEPVLVYSDSISGTLIGPCNKNGGAPSGGSKIKKKKKLKDIVDVCKEYVVPSYFNALLPHKRNL